MYDKLWDEGLQKGTAEFGDLGMAVRFLDLVQLPKPGQTILEIGCGAGTLCDVLVKRGCRDLIGIDVARSAVEHGKHLLPHLDLRWMDAQHLDFPSAAFDVCLSFDVVEHLRPIDQHFKEVHRILRSGGAYLFETPNLFSNAVFSTITYRGLGWREIHCSLQTSASLKRHLRRAGFARVEFVRVPLTPGAKELHLPAPVRRAYLAVPWTKLPIALQTNFYVVAYKEGEF